MPMHDQVCFICVCLCICSRLKREQKTTTVSKVTINKRQMSRCNEHTIFYSLEIVNNVCSVHQQNLKCFISIAQSW